MLDKLVPPSVRYRPGIHEAAVRPLKNSSQILYQIDVCSAGKGVYIIIFKLVFRNTDMQKWFDAIYFPSLYADFSRSEEGTRAALIEFRGLFSNHFSQIIPGFIAGSLGTKAVSLEK